MPVLNKLIGFLASAKIEEAKAFYGGVLAFPPRGEDSFALVFDANGTMIRLTRPYPRQGGMGSSSRRRWFSRSPFSLSSTFQGKRIGWGSGL